MSVCEYRLEQQLKSLHTANETNEKFSLKNSFLRLQAIHTKCDWMFVCIGKIRRNKNELNLIQRIGFFFFFGLMIALLSSWWLVREGKYRKTCNVNVTCRILCWLRITPISDKNQWMERKLPFWHTSRSLYLFLAVFPSRRIISNSV